MEIYDGKENTWKKMINAKMLKKDIWCPPIVLSAFKRWYLEYISKLWNDFQKHMELGSGAMEQYELSWPWKM